MFCAAITMYSPLAQWRATKGGLSVGVIGIGGLGQAEKLINETASLFVESVVAAI